MTYEDADKFHNNRCSKPIVHLHGRITISNKFSLNDLGNVQYLN
jgi:hypothetical protein